MLISISQIQSGKGQMEAAQDSLFRALDIFQEMEDPRYVGIALHKARRCSSKPMTRRDW